MTCDCHPGAPRAATHRNPRSGFLLCALSAERAQRRVEWTVARLTPVPLVPSLFDKEDA